MENSIISEGKTTNEAIENGLKKLKARKEQVEIKVLENEDKRSFFSILTPRVVKVQLTLKENNDNINHVEHKPMYREIVLTEQEQSKAKENLQIFVKDFFDKMGKSVDCEITTSEKEINVNIRNRDLGFLIGYRGETLYSMQNILVAIAGKGIENRVRVILDIGEYKEKREKTLEELAEKIAKTVIRNKKSITLEPMQSYERKIIHSKLQENDEIETKSIGEEPRRRIVVSIKKH